MDFIGAGVTEADEKGRIWPASEWSNYEEKKQNGVIEEVGGVTQRCNDYPDSGPVGVRHDAPYHRLK